MRLFTNINGFDIYYVEPEGEQNILELKISSIKNNKTIDGTCILPSLDWVENNGLDSKTVNYLTDIIKTLSEEIMKEAHSKRKHGLCNTNTSLEETQMEI